MCDNCSCNTASILNTTIGKTNDEIRFDGAKLLLTKIKELFSSVEKLKREVAKSYVELDRYFPNELYDGLHLLNNAAIINIEQIMDGTPNVLSEKNELLVKCLSSNIATCLEKMAGYVKAHEYFVGRLQLGEVSYKKNGY